MIFVWSLLEDPTTRCVYDWLIRLGANVAFLNHAEIRRTRVDFRGEILDRYRVALGDSSYELTEMSAAYLRPYDYRDYTGYIGNEIGSDVVATETIVHHLINGWAEHTAAVVINRPSAEASNHSKLYQAERIRRSGFRVPESVITNNRAHVKEFQGRHGQVVYKSMSSVRSIVRELDHGALDHIERMGPVLFQQHVAGTNIRVHVVGEETIACAIESEGIDYRYARSNVAPFSLPTDVAERCVRLTAQLSLVLSGIDLIRTAGGDWDRLEVNPNPAFSCYDLSEDKIISRAVAQALMR